MSKTDKLEVGVVIFQRGGYVSDYNESEASCEWVCARKNAHVFPDAPAATKAIERLTLRYAAQISIP